jgi:hypothetical protein
MPKREIADLERQLANESVLNVDETGRQTNVA